MSRVVHRLTTRHFFIILPPPKEETMAEIGGKKYPYSDYRIAGDLVFLAGVVGTAPDGELLEGITEQTLQALTNLDRVLESIGIDGSHNLTLRNIVDATVFLADMKDFEKVNMVWWHMFAEHFPARACVAVKELPLGALIEIKAIAVIP
jgi:2-iminobutanoate/2-iminopropanoate deaminase